MNPRESFMGISLREGIQKLNQEVSYSYSAEADPFQILKTYGFAIENNILATEHL